MANKLPLIASIIALATAVLAFLTAWMTYRSVDEQVTDVKQQIEETFSCLNEAEINVRQPLAEDRVSAHVVAWGEASVHPRCRYVYVFVRDLSTAGALWRVTGVTQTDREGRWSGIASLDHLSVGGKAEIQVRLTARAVYKPIPTFLDDPPAEGVPSQTIRVWRIE